MRLFPDLRSAMLEIRRDLTRAPKIQGHTVQSVPDNRLFNEAINYQYGILADGFPEEPEELVDLAREDLPFWDRYPKELELWVNAELNARIGAGENRLHVPVDDLNPELAKFREGGTWAYSYNQRMLGWSEAMTHALSTPNTRRAYWPIYHPMDAVRAHLHTRIPCTLGYQWTARPMVPTVMESEPSADYLWTLEGTILQRSCDFERFWISDIWFTYALTQVLMDRLNVLQGQMFNPGYVYHNIISFHRFIEPTEEIY